MSRHSKKPVDAKPETLQKFYYSCYKLILRLFTLIPFPLRYKFGESLGRLFYSISLKRRKIALRNLELAFPEWDEEKRNQVARESFINFGRLTMEFLQFPLFGIKELEEIVEIENREAIINAKKKGKGVVFLTAHFGNWELSALAFGVSIGPADVVVRPLDNKVADMLVEHYRTITGNRVVGRKRAAGAILKSLKENRYVGILMDQNQLRSRGIFADFFGIPACTTPAIAMITRKTKSPVIPAFLVRNGYKDYKLIFQPEVELEFTVDKERDLIVNTERFNKVIEDIIRQYPEQYFWLHRRWKTRPEGESGFY